MKNIKKRNDDISHLKLRLPSELKSWLKNRAKEKRRSMNSEIIFMLMQKKEKEDRALIA